MKELLIDVRNLSHTYMVGTPQEKEALTDVNISVNGGEAVALIGPTGSGKSTLLQHINGIYTPQSGKVKVLDRDLGDPHTDLTWIRRHVGLVFQRPGDQIFERYVGDDVAFGPRLAGLTGKDLTRRVRWAMELSGLNFEAFKDRLTYNLSGGERRKVGLAGVVALNPRVLLLDEPTSGLDPEAHGEILVRLKALLSEGISMVMATHSMDDVACIADRVYVLERGHVMLSGETRDVFTQIDRLKSLGLDVPTFVSLMASLRKQGWDVPLDMLTAGEAENAIMTALGEKV